jgi:hypothetical protein
MSYAKGVLAGVAAIFGVLLVPLLINVFWGISNEKATGLAVVAGGLHEAFRSPLFWVETLCVFALFFAAGRVGSKALRVLLFWAPAITITTLGCAITALLTLVVLFLRHRS